jgi:hypothetical protein
MSKPEEQETIDPGIVPVKTDERAEEAAKASRTPKIKLEEENYMPPELSVSEEDMERFDKSALFGTDYTEILERGDLKVKLRTRTKREAEFVTWMGDYEARNNLVSSRWELTSRINTFNMIYSIVGVSVGDKSPFDWIAPYPAPPRPWRKEHAEEFSKFVESHPVSDISEAMSFVLLAMLIQFQTKIFALEKSAIERAADFTDPGRQS